MTTPRQRQAEVESWIARTWDPQQRLGWWWERVALAGYAVPTWPQRWHGLGVNGAEARAIRTAFRVAGVPGPPAGLGVMLAGPTMLAHGTDEQRSRLLWPIVSGTSAWCQLFSEPGAGSDLPALSTQAVRDGDSWRVTGQKVWTSNGQIADKGMLLARTDPGTSGRHGITWFVIEMDQPAVVVRPLREMTGRSLFTEVFLDGAVVRGEDAVGAIGDGWTVARTTLANERAGLAEGGAVGGTPGTKAGMLDLPCADVIARLNTPRRRSGTAAAMRARVFDQLLVAARARGATSNPIVRQELARLYSLERLASLDTHSTPAGVAKLRQGLIVRLAADLGSRVLGPEGMLASGTDDSKTTEDIGFFSEFALFSPAVSIYGGTDEIQRNQLGERVLGLPRS